MRPGCFRETALSLPTFVRCLTRQGQDVATEVPGKRVWLGNTWLKCQRMANDESNGGIYANEFEAMCVDCCASPGYGDDRGLATSRGVSCRARPARPGLFEE